MKVFSWNLTAHYERTNDIRYVTLFEKISVKMYRQQQCPHQILPRLSAYNKKTRFKHTIYKSSPTINRQRDTVAARRNLPRTLTTSTRIAAKHTYDDAACNVHSMFTQCPTQSPSGRISATDTHYVNVSVWRLTRAYAKKSSNG
jgi:hypothetical protein